MQVSAQAPKNDTTIHIILNPNAGSAAQATRLREVVANHPHITLRETTGAGQATRFAVEALRLDVDLIVAAGGDGTINEVVNGLAANFARARLGIIPLGTGNDLARTLALPTEPLGALDILTSGPERWLDLIKVATPDLQVYAINAANGGFCGKMDEAMSDTLKQTWGPLAYILGATKLLPDLTGYKTMMTCDEGAVEQVKLLNISVANGRTAGGGHPIAPLANPEDGLLDLVIIRYGSVKEMAEVAARFVAGSYLESEFVSHRRVRRLRVYSRPGMWFNVDGELLTNEPVTITVQPRVLRVIVGPDYTPVPNAS